MKTWLKDQIPFLQNWTNFAPLKSVSTCSFKTITSIWEGFSLKFEKNLKKIWKKFEKNLKKIWKKFEKNFEKFEKKKICVQKFENLSRFLLPTLGMLKVSS